jgi:cytochrome d ubiquinol oxidase subunit I
MLGGGGISVDILAWGRLLTAITLAVHIAFAVFGVAMPLLISAAELLAIRRRDPFYRALAQRWARGFLVAFAVGAATGTIVAAELSVVWPRFMQVVGNVIALPFLIEVIAFFLEAIFLGVWLYGWERFRSPLGHWLTSLPMVVSGPASALLITIVNAFMNAPGGFRLVGGRVVAAQPWTAMFSPGWGIEVGHVLASAFTAAGFGLAAWAALSHLRTPHPYFRRQIGLTAGVGLVGVVASIVTGDLSGKFLAHVQPLKLAAMEGLFRTQAAAPLTVGGYVDAAHRTVVGGIQLPGLLSWLAYGSTAHPVRGLDAFPPHLWPPLAIHVFFDLMVAFGGLLLVVGAVYALVPALRERHWFLALLVAMGPVAFLAMEFGWMVDELGRQPYIVYGVMTVGQAITANPDLPAVAVLVLALLAAAGVGVVWGLMRIFRSVALPEDGAAAGSEEAMAG